MLKRRMKCEEVEAEVNVDHVRGENKFIQTVAFRDNELDVHIRRADALLVPNVAYILCC